jgi:hypothetical protein
MISWVKDKRHIVNKDAQLSSMPLISLLGAALGALRVFPTNAVVVAIG